MLWYSLTDSAESAWNLPRAFLEIEKTSKRSVPYPHEEDPTKEGSAMSSEAGSGRRGGSSAPSVGINLPHLLRGWIATQFFTLICKRSTRVLLMFYIINYIYPSYIRCSCQQTIGKGGTGRELETKKNREDLSHKGELELLEFVVQCTAPLEMVVWRTWSWCYNRAHVG